MRLIKGMVFPVCLFGRGKSSSGSGPAILWRAPSEAGQSRKGRAARRRVGSAALAKFGRDYQGWACQDCSGVMAK